MKYAVVLCKKLIPYYKNQQVFRSIISRNASSGVNLFSEMLETSTKKNIELYWRDKIHVCKYDENDKTRKPFYILAMFPYPSGALHMGHVRVYTISDAVAHFYRMKGYNVLHPMGWDAFGLPAENVAIEKKVDPAKWTKQNIETMKNQLNMLNYSFDWEREFATCHPEYYRWTQELFLKLFDKGMAYQKESFVNWDPIDQTVLAEEQVDENNRSWRSGAKVEKKLLKQWFIRTTSFAKPLLEGLNDPSLKEYGDIIKMQKNWIGDCKGTSFELEVISNIPEFPKSANVWVDAPEFIEYAKFIAISPKSILNNEKYSQDISVGVKELDAKVINPFTTKELPVYITDKVTFPLWRDVHIGIPSASMEDLKFSEIVGIPFTRHGIRTYEQQQEKLSEVLTKAKEWKIGGYPVSSRLQDWLISRQRYWGTPIPIIHCETCGAQPVPPEQLPVTLPDLEFSSSSDKLSLLDSKAWLNTSCPKCGGPANRDADTMDTFVDSSWYFLRFIDPHNKKEMFSSEKVKHIYPVDLYVGGKEHGVLHLYYARFISHFLHSENLVPYTEPFKQLLVQGMILGQTYKLKKTRKYLRPDEVEEKEKGVFTEKGTGEPVLTTWEKMSKSKHNGVDPLEVLDKNGIDTTRLLILGDVAPTSNRNWSDHTLQGITRWQNRVWLTVQAFIDNRNNISIEDFQKEPTHPKFAEDDLHMFDSRNYFLKAVTFNITTTQQLSIAISRMQGLTNSLRKVSKECMVKSREFERALAVQIIMLAPLAPHFASELWAGFCSAKHHLISNDEVNLDKDVLEQNWPEIDMDYKLCLYVYMNNQEVLMHRVPRRILDQLTVETAFDLVKGENKIQKRLKTKRIADTKLRLEAGYGAYLHMVTEKCSDQVAL